MKHRALISFCLLSLTACTAVARTSWTRGGQTVELVWRNGKLRRLKVMKY